MILRINCTKREEQVFSFFKSHHIQISQRPKFANSNQFVIGAKNVLTAAMRNTRKFFPTTGIQRDMAHQIEFNFWTKITTYRS